ncbi:MAG: FAD-dependent thymidylate synthase [Alphaproteobacteria bacterium]|nr:FAD-dependent thymidylate synthase [Alphaproteobacteria bacterium]
MPLTPEQKAEIEAQRADASATRRPTVAALEKVLYQALPVLDHGFIRVIDYLGDDAAIVQAARVSYGKGTRKLSTDRGLIRYLMRHRHTTPFEMCEIKLHVKLPIFVARQWIRHRTANVNEYSARYSLLENEFYVPDRDYLDSRRAERRAERQLELFDRPPPLPPEHLAAQSRGNRQGRGGTLRGDEAEEAVHIIHSESERAHTHYEKLLNEKVSGEVIDPDRQGLARELARMVLPVNFYTQWYWKIDLYNLLHFLGLRTDDHAQYEIRAYANLLCEIVEKWVPLVWEAFNDFHRTGADFSGPGLEALRGLLDDAKLADADKLEELRKGTGMSPREWREMMEALGRED